MKKKKEKRKAAHCGTYGEADKSCANVPHVNACGFICGSVNLDDLCHCNPNNTIPTRVNVAESLFCNFENQTLVLTKWFKKQLLHSFLFHGVMLWNFHEVRIVLGIKVCSFLNRSFHKVTALVFGTSQKSKTQSEAARVMNLSCRFFFF